MISTVALAVAMVIAAVFGNAHAAEEAKPREAPMLIPAQDSFAVGGTVVRSAGTFDPTRPSGVEGQTLHGDHARVFYQIPPTRCAQHGRQQRQRDA